MKKILSVLIGMGILLSFMSVKAMETKTYTKTISSGKPLIVYIDTYRQGDVTAHVVWNGKPTGHGIYYILNVAHCTDAGGTCYFSYDLSCLADSNQWPTQEMSCIIPNGPAGRYEVEFSADTKATATLDITAETNP